MRKMQVSQVEPEPKKCKLFESRNDLENAKQHYYELYNKNVLKLRIKLGDRFRKDQPALRHSCAEILSFADQIIDTVRRMMYGLNPSVLEALGLRAAIEQMVREFADYTEISIQTDIKPLKKVTSRETQINLSGQGTRIAINLPVQNCMRTS